MKRNYSPSISIPRQLHYSKSSLIIMSLTFRLTQVVLNNEEVTLSLSPTPDQRQSLHNLSIFNVILEGILNSESNKYGSMIVLLLFCQLRIRKPSSNHPICREVL